jgi:hypothetical protein
VGIDEVADRIAVVRMRFANRLAAKIADTSTALPALAGEVPGAAAAVTTAYRRFHEMCGIAPTIGFDEIGRAARTLDTLLIEPFRAERGLTANEMIKLTDGLEALRAAARIEITINEH